jgi:hypothetical protein
MSLWALLGLQPDENALECRSDLRAQEWGRVEISSLLSAASQLETTDHRKAVQKISEAQRAKLEKYFLSDAQKVSRLEQFYSLLYWMTELVGSPHEVSLDVASVKRLLKTSQAFQSPELIDAITDVTISWDRQRGAKLTMKLSQREIVFPLNQRRGFRAFQHGFCQHVQNLIVYGLLDVSIQELENQNLEVTFHRPVDLEGRLGTRGMVDLDLQYISVLSLEFLHGSRLGRTRARIAPREFASHEHPWWLRWISRVVSETSVQPIDW